MSKLYSIIVLIIYIIMLYMWIMVVVRKNYRSSYLIKAIGISVGFAMNIIAAFVNSGVLFGVYTYGTAIGILILLCIFAFILCRNKENGEKRRIQKNILSSPIYQAVIDEFNQNNYGAIYICSDGVAFCRSVSEYSFPEERLPSSETSEIAADRQAKTRAEKWEQKYMSIYGVSFISNAIRNIWYSTFGYANMREKERRAFTMLLAEKLQLKCRFFCKRFIAEGSSSTTGPTGAVTVNGVTTFTGVRTIESSSGSYSLSLFGVAYRKEAVLPKQELKQW